MKNSSLLVIFIILTGCLPIETMTASQPTPSSVMQFTTTSTAAIQPPTITPTVTFKPTTTQPIPTYPPTKNPALTLELLQTNNGCELPCWWGIIPNQSRWDEAENLLRSFSHIFSSESPTWTVYFVRSPISKEYSELGEVRSTFATQRGIIKEIEISEFDEKTYHLSSFLQKYGIPAQVLISTYSSDYGLPPNQVSLSVNLYYPEKGINALYGTYATVKDAQISGCLEKSPRLFLWSPSENNRSIDYILGWDKSQTPYMDIQDAINLDVRGFYEKYKNPENAPCLQTPAGLWPGQ